MKFTLTKEDVASLYWRSMKCTQSELNLDITLQCGQSFRWTKFGKTDEWIGVVEDKVWILWHNDDMLQYKIINERKTELDCLTPTKRRKLDHQIQMDNEARIKNYFRLNYSLHDLHKRFCETDAKFLELFPNVQGVRLLRQDPVETLFSFICSSNNNITRISGMVEHMSRHFGRFIAEIDGCNFYEFLKISKLAEKGAEAKLKSLGFGYRAKFIHDTAVMLIKEHQNDDNCKEYLYELRCKEYDVIKKQLMSYPGIGAKVADCICLMALDKLNVVPVDTHVRQIAERDYKLKVDSKSLTDASYKKISTFFQMLWGPYAGWAQSIAFSGQLKPFRSPKKK